MQAVVLAGGMGQRLMPLTRHMPKPMMPIIDRPMLTYTLDLLRRFGIIDIAITLGYRGEDIRAYYGDGQGFGVNITYFSETEPLGTAGSVYNARDFFEGDFLIMSGDALTNMNIADFVAFHRSHDSMLSMAVTRRDNVDGLGVVNMDKDARITSFVEKPKDANSNIINTGIYIAKRDIFDYILPHTFFDFSRDLFPMILPYMYGYLMDYYWSDIGTLSSYYLTNNFVAMHPSLFHITL